MFELRTYSPEDILAVKDIVQEGLAFCEPIEALWKEAGQFKDGVTVYTRQIGSDYWAARVSYHDDISYETFKETIFHNHTKYEAEYIPMVSGYESLEVPELLKGWHSERVDYKFPFPLTERHMFVWLYLQETRPDQFICISLPSKIEKGAYTSIEVVEQVADGKVRWTMAQTSDAGGWLPRWVQKQAIASSIAQDIPLYKAWLASRTRSTN